MEPGLDRLVLRHPRRGHDRVDLVEPVAGIIIVHGGKLWYLDRMVLLFEDMKHRNSTYATWEYGP